VQQIERVRKIPHVEGQFASLFYIDVNDHQEFLYEVATKLRENILKNYPEMKLEVIPADSYHISLSRPFYLN